MKRVYFISVVIAIVSVAAFAGCPVADLTGDCRVNLEDLGVLASQWLFEIDVPEGMVPVAGGGFAYQNDYNNQVYVGDIAIDKYEVTVQEYCNFLNAADPAGNHWDSNQEITQNGSPGAYTYAVNPGRENYPVRYVSYNDAVAYAQWRSSVEGGTYRVPTEQEWEKAAGWDPVQEYLWTFGCQRDSIDCSWANYNGASCYGQPLPVGSFDGTDGKNDAYSYYGCYDMTGNVYEWTSSIYTGSSRVIRGGGWISDAYFASVTFRDIYSTPSSRLSYAGFRLVIDLE